MTAQPTVFVVDDDASVRKALERLLGGAGYRVTSFARAADFLSLRAFDVSGCLLLDLAMPEMDGLELQAALAEMDNAMPVIFLTGHGDIPASVQAMKAGAVDFLTKPVDEEALLAAIGVALERQSQTIEARRNIAALRSRFETLSPREHEVMQLVVSGMLNKQIASQLGISEKTVKVHRARVMEKTGSSSLAELVRMCAALTSPGDASSPSLSLVAPNNNMSSKI